MIEVEQRCIITKLVVLDGSIIINRLSHDVLEYINSDPDKYSDIKIDTITVEHIVRSLIVKAITTCMSDSLGANVSKYMDDITVRFTELYNIIYKNYYATFWNMSVNVNGSSNSINNITLIIFNNSLHIYAKEYR